MIFLLGGARSGKSALAVSLASRARSPVRFIATARSDEDGMRRRIDRHRRDRPAEWTLVEEPIDIPGALRSAPDAETIVLDCITLWLSNLMVDHSDDAIHEQADRAIEAIKGRSGQTIVVSNEVGAGIVPMNEVGRRFRDLQGRVNQAFAGASDSAFLVVAGRLLRLGDFDDVY